MVFDHLGLVFVVSMLVDLDLLLAVNRVVMGIVDHDYLLDPFIN